MQFEKGYIYHIYNQGNNQRNVFYNKENYTFFLEKIKIYLLPFADIIAYCLMPNHFHLMVLVNEIEITKDTTHTVTQSHGVSKLKINDAVGIILRSYTRAINKQENFSGKLFREKTKASCVNCHKLIKTPSWASNNNMFNLLAEKQYSQVCFDYIHQNPVKAGLVENEEEYEFSSARIFANLKNDELVNKKVAFEYIDYTNSNVINTHTVTSSHGVSKTSTKGISKVNPELELALNFIEKTDRNIFLTGKAGTGKTTFLHKIKNESNKRLVVVAPTGVAAINAKGVTIHSFFQMPFGALIPGVTHKKSKFRFSKTKIDIIRSLDLLIIDEISMVRADLLDGIDQVLRRYKSRNKVFGGVQVLMIGDLQQLAPVVKPYEWDLLQPHYDTVYFFSSQVFQKANTISIELKHIYRQADEVFITILNEIRDNKLSEKSAAILNARYNPDFTPKVEEGYITLTTHNNRAMHINNLELDKLETKSKKYSAKITGKYSEYAYPTEERLELKVGAQVMFIKNDSSFEKRYYNGKIGTIVHLDKDSVWVNCKGDDDDIETSWETWENVTYKINENTKEIAEKTVGSFSQIPLRLAWAITIHKSQGLTFEKAIIDAEASFAHGQTYVALSRCKSLAGIVLKTKIGSNAIINDGKVTSFTHQVEANQPTEKDLSQSQKLFQLNLVEELFSYQAFLYPIQRLTKIYYENKTSLKGNIIEPLNLIKDEGVVKLMQVSTTFKKQLVQLSQDVIALEADEKIQERIQKGIHYFKEQTMAKIKTPFESITFSSDNKAVKKDFSKQIDALDDLISIKLTCFNGLSDQFTTSKYLELRAKAILEKIEIKPDKAKVQREAITDTDYPELFEKLRELRMELANENEKIPYQIFTQDSLYEMCAYFPATPSELQQIKGMGSVRVEKYGDAILAVINEYVKNKEVVKKEVNYVPKKNDTKPKKINTKDYSLELFKKGLTIAEIAKERNLAISTIEVHLAHFVPTGELKITDLISLDKYNELKEIMKTTKYENFTALKQQIDDKFTYAELRLVAQELNV